MHAPTVSRVRVPPNVLIEQSPAPAQGYRTSAAVKGPLRIVQRPATREGARLVGFGLLAAVVAAVLVHRAVEGYDAVLFVVVTGAVVVLLPYLGLRRLFNRTTITVADERLELRVGPFPPGFRGWMFVSTVANVWCESDENAHRVVADRVDGLQIPLSEWRRDEDEARCIEQALNAYLGRVVVVD